MPLNCGVGEDSWESLELQGDPTSKPKRKSFLNIHWKAWCWSCSSNTLAIWCEELTHLKSPWCWERLKAGEGDDRWDGWMALLNLMDMNVGKLQELVMDRGVVWCSPRGQKVLDRTERMNWTELNPLQYSCLEDSVDRRAWWATVRWVTKNRKQLGDCKDSNTTARLTLSLSIVIQLNIDTFYMVTSKVLILNH